MEENGNNELKVSFRADKNKRAQDGTLMVNNLFELIQIMINYSFHLQSADDDDLVYEDEDESLDKMDQYPSSSFNGMSNLSLNEKTDDDVVYRTFMKIHDSLPLLSETEDANFLEANPIMIVHFSARITDTLTKLQNELKGFSSADEGASVMNSLNASLDSVCDFLVDKICSGWIEGFNKLK